MEAPKNIQDASQEKLIKGGFPITFIIQRGKLRIDGTAPILARMTVNGKMTHLATKQYIRNRPSLPQNRKLTHRRSSDSKGGQVPQDSQVSGSKEFLRPTNAKNGYLPGGRSIYMTF